MNTKKRPSRENVGQALSVCTLYKFHMPESVGGGNGTVGAGVGAGAAVEAGGSVNHVLVIALTDSASGAGVGASATAHTSGRNLICHDKYLQSVMSVL